MNVKHLNIYKRQEPHCCFFNDNSLIGDSLNIALMIPFNHLS